MRLAHRAVELESSALFKKSPCIQNICSGYKESFAQIVNLPAPINIEKEANFARIVEVMYERHSSTMITMAKGAHELRTLLNQDVSSFADTIDIQKRLDDFYMSRIGIRMVCTALFYIVTIFSDSLNGFIIAGLV